MLNKYTLEEVVTLFNMRCVVVKIMVYNHMFIRYTTEEGTIRFIS